MASINDLPDTVEALSPVAITGTATDNDGNSLTTDGRVAAVEVSVDGGSTWKLASSTDNWGDPELLLVSDAGGCSDDQGPHDRRQPERLQHHP
jgi:hypothetical protein